MDLEPWNMFSTDIEGMEQDNVGVDNEVVKNTVCGNNGNGNDDDVVVPPTPAKKRGFDQEESDNEQDTSNSNDYAKRLRRSNATAAVAHDVEDDNATFNFNTEVSIHRTNTPRAVNQASNYKPGDEKINFDLGVVYICPACGLEYDEQNQWKLHMNSRHSFNTRHGLNFVQIDKLYHECRECSKRIAMHSMENLLKHKFTHLPYRCTKCKICERQYKYRQDLMLHVRYMHRDELAEMTRKRGSQPTGQVSGNRSMNTSTGWRSKRLEIKNIQKNAKQLYESDAIEVKNEPAVEIDDDIADGEQADNDIETIQSMLEDSASGESSRQGGEEDNPERWILYICPQCGDEFGAQHHWRIHIERVHHFNTHEGLNFREVNKKQHAQCLECSRLVYVNAIRNLQVHKFRHLRFKKWMACKICSCDFSTHKEVIAHLADVHGKIANSKKVKIDEVRDSQFQMSSAPPEIDRSIFEEHIEYLCPQCGKDFFEKKQWRTHLVMAHNLADLNVLRFKVISDRQLMCLECCKTITKSNGVQNAQQHRFTHMPHKSYIRCRLCGKSYTDRKGLIKHLHSIHRVGTKYFITQTGALTTAAAVAAAKQRNSSVGNALQMAKTAAATAAASAKLATNKRKAPRTEIVERGEYIFEIQYLNESDDDEIDEYHNEYNDYAMNGSISGNNNSNGKIVDNGQQQQVRVNCDDCGSIFHSKSALDMHVRKEHEFLDYHNLRSVHRADIGDGGDNAKAQSDDDDDDADTDADADNNSNSNDLLVPAAEEEVKYATEEGSTDIESNFIYLCPACGQELATLQDWRRHIYSVHNFNSYQHLNFEQLSKQSYKCRQCGVVLSNFVKLKTLQDHKFRHLPYKLYIKCLLCGTCYNHKPNMLNHLYLRHNIGEARGGNPGSSNSSISGTGQVSANAAAHRFPSAANSAAGENLLARLPGQKTLEDTVTFHNAVDLDFITYYCPQCNENFDSHLFWRKHIVDAHNLASKEGLSFRQIDDQHYMCLHCYKRVTVTHSKGAIGQLQSHKFRHLPYRSFKCLTCNELFVRKQMFFKHLDRQTNRCKGINDDDAESSISSSALKVERNEQRQEKQKQPQPQSQDEQEEDDDTIYPATPLLLEPQQDMQLLQPNDFETDDAVLPHAIFGMFDNCSSDMLPYTFACPQCGKQLNTMVSWREHIQGEHGLGQRENLRFRRLSSGLSECIDCGERVCPKKLRHLQLHRFKHLRFSAFIQCRFCTNSYHNVHNVENHVRVNHPDEYTPKQSNYLEENSISDVDANSMQARYNGVPITGIVQTVDNDDNDDDDNDNEYNDNDEPEILLG